MARQVNYEEKIKAYKEKIERVQEQIKGLKAEVSALEAAKVKNDFKSMNEYLAGKGLAPDEVMAKLKEIYGE